MGPVLDPGPAPGNDLYIYAHCMRDRPGGVTILAINAGQTSAELETSLPGERYMLAAKELQSTAVQLNGRELEASSDGDLPQLNGGIKFEANFTQPSPHLRLTADARSLPTDSSSQLLRNVALGEPDFCLRNKPSLIVNATPSAEKPNIPNSLRLLPFLRCEVVLRLHCQV